MAWDEAALDDLASYCESQRTTGLLAVEYRRKVLERNWPVPAGSELFERRYLQGTWHMARWRAARRRGVAAEGPGVAVGRHRGRPHSARRGTTGIALHWPRPFACRVNTGRAIEVRHLLEMCSGLDDALRFETPAGTRHYYDTPAYALMLPVLEAAADQSIGALILASLTGPAGMADTAWCQRGDELANLLGNPRGLVPTPRDLARMGQIVLDGGLAERGARLVSSTGLSASLRRTVRHSAYARLRWLNGATRLIVPNRGEGSGSLVPTAPALAVFALGPESRALIGVPSQRLILVRLGQQAPDSYLREKQASFMERAMMRSASK